MEKMYPVYEIQPDKGCYGGMALVAADDVETANKYIRNFIKSDPDNYSDSWGYGFVSEYDIIEHLFSDEPGIIRYGIYYTG